MPKKTKKSADWKTSETRWYPYVGKLQTPKGIGYVKYDGQTITIHIALKIILNGVDLEQYASVDTRKIEDMEAAHDWVESFLL